MQDVMNGDGDLEQEWEEDLPPVAGGLIGKTLAELEMHAEARVALLNLLRHDPTVIALFDRWTETTEVGQFAVRAGEHLERTALTGGFAHVHGLMQALGDVKDGTLTVPLEVTNEAETEQVSAALTALVKEGGDLLDAFVAAVTEYDPAPLIAEAIVLVRDKWGLSWPWLAWELHSCWTRWVGNAPFGRKTVVQYWAESAEWKQPAPAITFQTTPDESIEDALMRCLREVLVPLEAAAMAAQLPRGRRTDAELVRRYTEWWYRRRIRGHSVRAIADKDDGKRSLVRYGITQADGWLGIVSWTWKDKPET